MTRDNKGRFYPIHALDGLVALDDHTVVSEPQSNLSYDAETLVHVGLNETTNDFRLPILDAVVRIGDASFVYVVPVLVEQQGRLSRAAAKLELFTPGSPGDTASWKAGELFVVCGPAGAVWVGEADEVLAGCPHGGGVAVQHQGLVRRLLAVPAHPFGACPDRLVERVLFEQQEP